MPRNLVFCLPVAGLALLASGMPAAAQTQVERQMYEPLYDFAFVELQKEVNAIGELQTALESETDLVRGCGMLNQSLVHLRKADKLLGDIETYTDKLRRTKDNRAAKKQHESVREDIALKESDIERLCSSLPES